MACTDPRDVSFTADGRITFSDKERSREFVPFQLPCGQCLECRLDYARQWAIRCVHEAKMHPENCFITLTYDDAHLGDNRLDYRDFQLFMKKLRKLQDEPMGFFATGEYGEKTKRKHWHAILFNYRPPDSRPSRKTSEGHQVFSSARLDETWGLGRTELGSVTFESAGYCARYAAKKICHGEGKKVRNADYHSFQPISKKSSKHAIGKKWLEKNFPDVFNHGDVQLFDGSKIPVPRYYERWFKEHHPDLWWRYVTEVKNPKIGLAQERAEKEKAEWVAELHRRRDAGRASPKTKREIEKIISEKKFQMLQSFLKL